MVKKLILQDFPFTQLNKVYFHKQNPTVSDYSPYKLKCFTQLPTSDPTLELR